MLTKEPLVEITLTSEERSAIISALILASSHPIASTQGQNRYRQLSEKLIDKED